MCRSDSEISSPARRFPLATRISRNRIKPRKPRGETNYVCAGMPRGLRCFVISMGPSPGSTPPTRYWDIRLASLA
jgi:hypothetical protein